MSKDGEIMGKDRNKIKFIIMDVDGTLTDGKIHMGDDGEVFKSFNIKDGYGIHDIAMGLNIEPIIITGRKSRIVENRCNELGISKIFQGISDKLEILKNVTTDYKAVAYIGDDNNDIECMKFIKQEGGIIGCPKDSSADVIDIADYICEKCGGEGAVREFIEWLVETVI